MAMSQKSADLYLEQMVVMTRDGKHDGWHGERAVEFDDWLSRFMVLISGKVVCGYGARVVLGLVTLFVC